MICGFGAYFKIYRYTIISQSTYKELDQFEKRTVTVDARGGSVE